jgi:hypothetical protein
MGSGGLLGRVTRALTEPGILVRLVTNLAAAAVLSQAIRLKVEWLI